ncbi:hypothetical protein GQ600_1024 [Phytophthora cactorum]|nr:hypothetical protein GQ600_1024 [Phytophthora cactorum]
MKWIRLLPTVGRVYRPEYGHLAGVRAANGLRDLGTRAMLGGHTQLSCESEYVGETEASTELQTELKDNDKTPGGNVGVAASLASGKLPSTSGVDSLKVKSAEVAQRVAKVLVRTQNLHEGGPCRIYYADVMKDNAQVATAKTSASRSGSKRADPPTEVLFADVMKATSSSGDIADSDNGLFVGTASMPVAYTKSVVQADTAEACSQNSSFSGGRASI